MCICTQKHRHYRIQCEVFKDFLCAGILRTSAAPCSPIHKYNVFSALMGLGARGKESACQCRSRGFDPWVRKIPWRRKWHHSSILAWRIPWTEEPGRLQSTGSHRVRHDRSDLAVHGAPVIACYLPSLYMPSTALPRGTLMFCNDREWP